MPQFAITGAEETTEKVTGDSDQTTGIRFNHLKASVFRVNIYICNTP